MKKFGFVSPLLEITSPLKYLRQMLPAGWKHKRGPYPTGELTVLFQKEQLLGQGFQTPKPPKEIEPKSFLNNPKAWQAFYQKNYELGIRVIGIDPAGAFLAPEAAEPAEKIPIISDGRALELLLFLQKFRNTLKIYQLNSQKTEVAILWEEGNLGAVCARLLAKELRFLTLIGPNWRSLERIANQLTGEAGITPKLFVDPLAGLKKVRIGIICGQLSSLTIPEAYRRIIWYKLFQNFPSLIAINSDLPLSVCNQKGMKIPLYPALGEAILRTMAELDQEDWVGTNLQLERMSQLARILGEIGVPIRT